MEFEYTLNQSALPFGTSPNPNVLYQTDAIRTAIHKIRYTITHKQGLTCILGDVGLGKSTILRYAFAEFDANDQVVASLMPTPNFASDFAFLKAVCGEFHLPIRRSLLDQGTELQEFLIKEYTEGRTVALFIDEGQKLSNKMLEVVRSMLNFETNENKLIQLVISAQLDLRDRLLDKALRAIKSRMVMPTLLHRMTQDETREMLEWRCRVAGVPVRITDEAYAKVFEIAEGVPRDTLSLVGAAYEMMKLTGLEEITGALVEGAEAELSIADADEPAAREAHG